MCQRRMFQGAIKAFITGLFPVATDRDRACLEVLTLHCEDQAILQSTAVPHPILAGVPGVPVCALPLVLVQQQPPPAEDLKACELRAKGGLLAQEMTLAMQDLVCMGFKAQFEDLPLEQRAALADAAREFVAAYVDFTNV